MKIVQSCEPVKPLVKFIKDVPLGTIFRFGNITCGPYLRAQGDKVVNLRDDSVSVWTEGEVNNYVELPNARLVLE